MTDHMQITCDEYEELLPRHLEDELSVAELDAVERHLTTCRRCWALRDEVLDIARVASELPVLTPGRELWTGIAERIETPVIALDTGEHAIPARPVSRRFQLAAAAAALVIGTAATSFAVARVMYAPDRMVAEAPVAPPQAALPVRGSPSVAGAGVRVVLASGPEQLGSAEAAYAREIAELRAALDRRRPGLDSATVAILERNLAIIDSAITQSKAALARNPNSALLTRQLDRALNKKVEVLRTAVLLPIATE
jgi:hypothetical protein